MKRLALALVFSLPVGSLAGCITHAVHVEPISLEPVQVTMDVNLHVDDDRTTGEESPTTAATTTEGPTTVTQQ